MNENPGQQETGSFSIFDFIRYERWKFYYLIEKENNEQE
jgi:hypothetical protein